VRLPGLAHSLIYLSVLFRIALSEGIESYLCLLSHAFEPKENAINHVSRLGQVEHDAHSRASQVASRKSGLEEVGEVTSTTKLINIRLDLLVIVELEATLELESGSLCDVLLDLLVEEPVNERSLTALLLADED